MISSQLAEFPLRADGWSQGTHLKIFFKIVRLIYTRTFYRDSQNSQNKAKIAKHKIIPYCGSFLYCESRLFAHVTSVNTEKCTIASVYVLLHSSDSNQVYFNHSKKGYFRKIIFCAVVNKCVVWVQEINIVWQFKIYNIL